VWRFLVRLDATVLQAVLTSWLRARLPAAPAAPAASGRADRVVIAVDGKVLRAARLPEGRQVHLLSAYDTATGMVLAQVAIEAKSNEIPAFAPLRAQVKARLGSLAGTLILADALHAQVGHANTRRRPGWASDGPGEGQPAQNPAPAGELAVGAGPGRSPHPQPRPRSPGDPHRQSHHRKDPRWAGLPARYPGSADHPHPHHRRHHYPRGPTWSSPCLPPTPNPST
jgi:hypothetical protein